MENQENTKKLEKDDSNKKNEKKRKPREKLSPAEKKAKLIERYKLQCKKLNEEEKKEQKKKEQKQKKELFNLIYFLKENYSIDILDSSNQPLIIGTFLVESPNKEEMLKKGSEIIKKFNLKQEEIREERRKKRKKDVVSEETNE
ncbi:MULTISPECIES: hypothetical protein [Fusobacterium]|jgi:hypothetical protein|uniref:Uncharacterized protein n=1 Tax=Fusobacterium nucleatum TaxID=851 RepID=A0A323TYY4_FUSNU|nr:MULTISPECIES: hypothetical protein [Fusobacterium]PCR84323.1 hypothetical protein CQA79_10475 [Fusobacterium nucleatum]PZA05099.1 hypothetical protein DNF10_02160 [Fusobacterium nucleatum]QJX51648.1 hypothetical protein HOO60_12190 [Fusobacterium nucleatum]QYR60134.1 hypothetical protein JY397_05980 [Fusobacterium polymorphum]HCE32566.1 hypothetical protein [Fusobacterium sp.]